MYCIFRELMVYVWQLLATKLHSGCLFNLQITLKCVNCVFLYSGISQSEYTWRNNYNVSYRCISISTGLQWHLMCVVATSDFFWVSFVIAIVGKLSKLLSQRDLIQTLKFWNDFWIEAYINYVAQLIFQLIPVYNIKYYISCWIYEFCDFVNVVHKFRFSLFFLGIVLRFCIVIFHSCFIVFSIRVMFNWGFNIDHAASWCRSPGEKLAVF